MAHESRLTRDLRALMQSRRTAALGTIGDDGAPFVSMVPFAAQPALGCLVLHVSGLSAHTRHLQERPEASLLVMQAEQASQPVHDLPRVTLSGTAELLKPGSPEWQAGRTAYLARFPEAEPMTQWGDFQFVAIHIARGRHIAGFGAARDIDREEFRRALSIAEPA
jgi:putative heme iron utilization protein